MGGILFFSGGTALKEVAKEFARRQIHSTHIITTFDSGGSSRYLRQAFHMPAVGDLRNRLLALASQDQDTQLTVKFLNRRLSQDSQKARMELDELSSTDFHSFLPSAIANPIRNDFLTFHQNLPDNFNPTIASVGNMVLTGAYLGFNRQLDKAVEKYVKMLKIVGRIIPVCNECRHLKARLASGAILIGQHLFKTVAEQISSITLVDEQFMEKPAQAFPGTVNAIKQARIICIPMGSFFSSIVANFLPRGISEALSSSKALKVFIPNSGHDPELGSLTVWAQLEILQHYMANPGQPGIRQVYIDTEKGMYNGNLQELIINTEHQDISLRRVHILRNENCHDPVVLADILVNLLETASA